MRRMLLQAAAPALVVLAGCGHHDEPGYVYGTVLDPERLLYARHGMLADQIGSSESGLCWTQPCAGAAAAKLRNVVALPGVAVGLIDDEQGTEATSNAAGDFLLPVHGAAGGHGHGGGGSTVYLVGHGAGKPGYRDTLNVIGVPVSGEAHGVMAPLCSDAGMMAKLGASVLDAGVLTVMVADNGLGLEFGMVEKNLEFQVTPATLAKAYWFFDPTSGWVTYDDPAKAATGQFFMGMLSVHGFDGKTEIELEVKDTAKNEPGRPYEYPPLHVEPPAGMLSLALLRPGAGGSGGHGN